MFFTPRQQIDQWVRRCYITTNDERLAGRLSIMRGFGFFWSRQCVGVRDKFEINEVHASMALACLDEID